MMLLNPAILLLAAAAAAVVWHGTVFGAGGGVQEHGKFQHQIPRKASEALSPPSQVVWRMWWCC
jgi:hypothetical protein